MGRSGTAEGTVVHLLWLRKGALQIVLARILSANGKWLPYSRRKGQNQRDRHNIIQIMPPAPRRGTEKRRRGNRNP